MLIIQKNILTVARGILGHQVNCQGVMGSGLAKQIRRKYPLVFKEYQKYYTNKKLVLGEIQLVKITDDLYICNLIAQDKFSRMTRSTDYKALEKCLTKLEKLSNDLELPVYLPYQLGCGLGGGDWQIVSKLIDDHCPWATVCQLVQD